MKGFKISQNGCFLAISAVLVCVFAYLLHGGDNARPEDVAAAISTARPECGAITRARLMAAISTDGAISDGDLRRTRTMECRVAGAQFDAAATAE